MNATDPSGNLAFLLVIPAYEAVVYGGGLLIGALIINKVATEGVPTIDISPSLPPIVNNDANEQPTTDAPKKKKAKDRRKEQQEKTKEQKYGDKNFEEPASEDYAKWKAKEVEKTQGKEKRRELHDQKQSGEGDRTKEQLEEDLKDLKNKEN